MKRPALRALGQVLIWAAGNSLAGAAVGLAVGFFREGGLEPPIILISVLFGNVVGFTVLVSSVVLFPRLRALGPVARFAFLGLALLSGAVAGTVVVLYLFPLFVLKDIPQAIAVAGINGVLAMIVGTVAYVYEGLRSQLAESLREVEEVRLVEARLKEQAARAELAALQARINPHFFFNTLNTISSMLEDEPEKAGEMVQTLADLFRFTFKVSDAGPVPLSEELRFIEGYLAIEQARFGERLRVAWNVEDSARQVPVPGLILQPLVENAVVHGLARLTAGGTVRISARRRESDVEIEVQDDGIGPGSDPDRLFREGHGLQNVRQRVLAVYRGGGSLRIARAPSGKGTVARLVLPAMPAWGRVGNGEESRA
jgi:sensor histidine kinase YesM